MRVHWTKRARRDVRQIVGYLSDVNPASAERLRQTLRTQASSLGVFPEMGRASRVLGVRELVIAGTAYLMACRIAERGVEILRVRHGARDWDDLFPM